MDTRALRRVCRLNIGSTPLNSCLVHHGLYRIYSYTYCIQSWLQSLQSSSNMAETVPPLPVFYAKTLGSLLLIFDDTLSLSDPSARAILSTAFDQLYLTSRIITSLGVFSENESVEELGENELVFMTVGWVIAEVEGRGGLGGSQARKQALERSDVRSSSPSAMEGS